MPVMVLVLVLELGLLKCRLKQRPDGSAAGSHATGSKVVIVPAQGPLNVTLCMSPDGAVEWAVDNRPPSCCSPDLHSLRSFGFAHHCRVAAVGRLVGVHVLLVESDVQFARRCRHKP